MVRNAKVHCINLGDQYIPFGSWAGDEKTIDLMLNYKIDDLKLNAYLKNAGLISLAGSNIVKCSYQ